MFFRKAENAANPFFFVPFRNRAGSEERIKSAPAR